MVIGEYFLRQSLAFGRAFAVTLKEEISLPVLEHDIAAEPDVLADLSAHDEAEVRRLLGLFLAHPT